MRKTVSDYCTKTKLGRTLSFSPSFPDSGLCFFLCAQDPPQAVCGRGSHQTALIKVHLSLQSPYTPLLGPSRQIQFFTLKLLLFLLNLCDCLAVLLNWMSFILLNLIQKYNFINSAEVQRNMNDSLLLFHDFPAAATKGLCNDGVYEGRREGCSAGTGDAVAVSQSAICHEDAAEKAERVEPGAWLQHLVSSLSCRNSPWPQWGEAVVGQQWWMWVTMAMGWSQRGVGHLCAEESCRFLLNLLPMAAGEAQPSCAQLCMILPWIRWAGCEGKAKGCTEIILSE